MDTQTLRRLNEQLASKLADASYVLSRAAERNGLVNEVMRLRAIIRNAGLDPDAALHTSESQVD